MTTLKTKSALSYFGSDSEVAKELAARLNHCRHVTIPFCGGLSILPHLTARAIVANDAHNQVINFYRYASGRLGDDMQKALITKCQHTLSHPDELQLAQSFLSDPAWNRTLSQAWAIWAACWIGRKGKGGTKHTGGMPSVRRTASGGTNATRITAAADDLAECVQQFRRCEWESRDFREVLQSVADNPECGVYCDPPWVGAGRNYLHSFTEQDHHDLAMYLQRFHETTVLVRYGDDPLIRDLYQGWHFFEATSRDQANGQQGEIWITNRAAQ